MSKPKSWRRWSDETVPDDRLVAISKLTRSNDAYAASSACLASSTQRNSRDRRVPGRARVGVLTVALLTLVGVLPLAAQPRRTCRPAGRPTVVLRQPDGARPYSLVAVPSGWAVVAARGQGVVVQFVTVDGHLGRAVELAADAANAVAATTSGERIGIVWTRAGGEHGIWRAVLDAEGNVIAAPQQVPGAEQMVAHFPRIIAFGGGFALAWTAGAYFSHDDREVHVARMGLDGTVNAGDVAQSVASAHPENTDLTVAVQGETAWLAWTEETGELGRDGRIQVLLWRPGEPTHSRTTVVPATVDDLRHLSGFPIDPELRLACTADSCRMSWQAYGWPRVGRPSPPSPMGFLDTCDFFGRLERQFCMPLPGGPFGQQHIDPQMSTRYIGTALAAAPGSTVGFSPGYVASWAWMDAGDLYFAGDRVGLVRLLHSRDDLRNTQFATGQGGALVTYVATSARRGSTVSAIRVVCPAGF